jgi:hypothetical protein
VTPANRNKETISEVREVVMPRCPLCRSALVTITFGLYPIAICTSCSARWIQDGHQQRAINQIQEPTLFASAQGPSLLAQASLLASSPTSTLTLAHRR